MFRITEVVKQLIIINVILFIAKILPLTSFLRDYLVLYIPTSDQFKPIQLVSNIFMHADEGHLFFNMLGLFFFGPQIESLWGGKKFLVYYFFCGVGATILHLIVGFDYDSPYLQTVQGASGAVYGIVLAYGMLFPETIVRLIIPPIPIKAKYMAMGYVAISLFSGLSGADDNIAHFAHLGGALFGFLLILFWRKFPFRM